MWNVEKILWKSERMGFLKKRLWKREKVSTGGCGYRILEKTGFDRDFHIKTYYYCYC